MAFSPPLRQCAVQWGRAPGHRGGTDDVAAAWPAPCRKLRQAHI